MNEVFSFVSARGKCPFADFIQELDARNEKTSLNNISRKIDALEVQGSRAIGKHLRDDVWQVTAGNYRVLFFPWRDKYVLSNGFRKKSAKTPENEIECARRHRNEWVKIHGQG